VAGYTSSQELLKLIRDLLPLKPDVVLCLDGVNEFGFRQSVPEHPMVHRYQKRLFRKLQTGNASAILPNTMKLFPSRRNTTGGTVMGASWGTTVKTTPARQWITNVRTARAVAEEFRIEYLVFLQPILGFGKYGCSPKEQEQLAARDDKYLRDVRAFYSEAKTLCADYSFCVDFTDVFEKEKDVYLNPRHQNERGVQILAEAVYAQLVARKLLPVEKSGKTEHQP